MSPLPCLCLLYTSGAIAVSAYSYMALVPVIQPPIMRWLTSKNERLIRMKPPRVVSHTEKVMFPIIGLLLTTFLVQMCIRDRLRTALPG